jgi:flagella basal body P-ring formation protein FlgA
MIRILLVFLLFSVGVSAETSPIAATAGKCSIELFSKVYRLESYQDLSYKDIIQKTNCDQLILNKISQIVSVSNGTIGADFLKREISKEFNLVSIEITPRKLSLLELNTIFKDQLAAGNNFYFSSSKSLNNLKTIGLTEEEQLKVNCESCNSLGDKNIKVDSINSLQGTTKTIWFSSRIMAKVKVFKAKRSISFQQHHLEPDNFYSDEVLTMNPDNALTTLDNIQFYKSNKNIMQDSIVSNLDLQAVNLINFGTPVNVSLKNQNINLQRTAMPIRSAMFGEVIELKNPNNNKIIAGKVVDYNKVVIEL